MEKRIVNRIIEYIFFSNFFMGLMALALNLETNIRLNLPLNNYEYYIFTTAITIVFYLFAYKVPLSIKYSTNPRIDFYIINRLVLRWFNRFLYVIVFMSGLGLLFKSIPHIQSLNWIHFIILGFTFFLSLGYYNWKFGLALRRLMWFKPILIAWTWAITTVYFPLLMLQLIDGINFSFNVQFLFLFSQTFMYFIVNAILFDMKDYEDDTNAKLKTFVVKYGYFNTLNRIIFPLIFLGFLAFIGYGIYFDLSGLAIILLECPIILLGIFAYMVNQKKSVLFYLVAIDGLIVIKVLFGILSNLFI